jgi:hypothetical protein
LENALQVFLFSNRETSVSHGVWMLGQSGKIDAPIDVRSTEASSWSIVHMEGPTSALASIDAISVRRPASFVPPLLRVATPTQSTTTTTGIDATTTTTTTTDESPSTFGQTTASLDNNAKPPTTSGVDSTQFIIIVIVIVVLVLCLLLVGSVIVWRTIRNARLATAAMTAQQPTPLTTRTTSVASSKSEHYQELTLTPATSPPANYSKAPTTSNGSSSGYSSPPRMPSESSNYDELQLNDDRNVDGFFI